MSGLNIVAAAVCVILLPVMAPAAENRANAPEAASGDMCGSVQVNVWQTVSRDREFRDALSLYGRGMYADAQAMFAGIAAKTGDMEAEGYRVLCAIHLGQDGYPVMMKDHIARYPYSGLIPQMRFFHALNLFDAEDYRGASEELEEEERVNERLDKALEVFGSDAAQVEEGNGDPMAMLKVMSVIHNAEETGEFHRLDIVDVAKAIGLSKEDAKARFEKMFEVLGLSEEASELLWDSEDPSWSLSGKGGKDD